MGEPVKNPAAAKDGIAGWPYAVVNSMAIVSGALHLGVFISHLYSIVARR